MQTLHRLALAIVALTAFPIYRLWQYAHHQPKASDPVGLIQTNREPLIRLYVVYLDQHPLLLVQAPDSESREKVLEGVLGQVEFPALTDDLPQRPRVTLVIDVDVPLEDLQRVKLLYELRIMSAGIAAANQGPSLVARPDGRRH